MRTPKVTTTSHAERTEGYRGDSIAIFDSTLLVIDGDKIYRDHSRTIYTGRWSERYESMADKEIAKALDASKKRRQITLAVVISCLSLGLIVVLFVWLRRRYLRL